MFYDDKTPSPIHRSKWSDFNFPYLIVISLMFWWATGRLLQQLRFREGSERCLNKTACAEKAQFDEFFRCPEYYCTSLDYFPLV